MHDLTTAEKFWYVARKVLLSPFSLALWAAGGVVSYWLGVPVASGLWWAPLLAAAGADAWLLFVRLHDEEYLRRIFLQRDERQAALSEQQIEQMLDKMDFETRQRIRYILQLQKEVVREARGDDVGSYARHDMDRISSQLPTLVDRAVRIAMRKQQLTRYLNYEDQRALQNYCNNLRQRITTMTDDKAREQYEQALRAREQQLQTYQAIAQAAARIDSQLENVEATFASWKAKIIRIKIADVDSVAAVSEGLYQELDRLNSEIDLLDSSVSEALASDQPQAGPAGTGPSVPSVQPADADQPVRQENRGA